jgi:hypothetical protein
LADILGHSSVEVTQLYIPNYNAEKNDLEFLLDKRRDLSERFNVDWTIQIEDGEIRSIMNGVCDPAVREVVEAMAGVSDERGEFGAFT